MALNRLGLIPKHLINTSNWNNWESWLLESGAMSVALVLIGIGMIILTFTNSVPTDIRSDFWKIGTAAIAGGVILWTWDSRSSMGPALTRLLILLDVDLPVFIGMNEATMKKRAKNVLTYKAALVMYAEREFDMSSDVAKELRRGFGKAHKLCLGFGLADEKYNVYYDCASGVTLHPEDKKRLSTMDADAIGSTAKEEIEAMK